MKEHFLDRLYGEYQEYKASVLGCTNAEIYDRCYEIDAMANFYEILAEKTEVLSDEILQTLLQHRGILSKMYQVWLKKYSSCYSEMQQHVEDELKGFVKELRGDEKDGKLHK